MIDFEAIEAKVREALSDVVVMEEDPDLGFGAVSVYNTGDITINPFPQEYFIPGNPFLEPWLNNLEKHKEDLEPLESITFLIPTRMRNIDDVPASEIPKDSHGEMKPSSEEEIKALKKVSTPALLAVSIDKENNIEYRMADFYFMRNEPVILGSFADMENGNESFKMMEPIQRMFELLND